MGRPRKPIALHVVQGTSRKKRLEARINELELPAGPMGHCPAWMPAPGRQEWDALTTHPQLSLVLNPAHRGALIEYCVLYARMVADAIGESKITASERQTLNSLRMQLGITPASQAKVKMPGEKPAESRWAATKPIPTSKVG